MDGQRAALSPADRAVAIGCVVLGFVSLVTAGALLDAWVGFLVAGLGLTAFGARVMR